MKLKKKSGLMGAVIALSAASLVSVGFASWVISQGDKENLSGTIMVDTVDNKNYQITASWVTSFAGDETATSHNVVYGHPKTMSNTSAWLTATGDMVEDLTFYLRLDVTNAKGKAIDEILVAPAKLTSTGGGEVGEKSGYAGAFADNLVADLPTPALDTGVTSFTAKTSDADETDGFVVYKIEFKWGSHFNGNNPYDFYNPLPVAANAEDAATSLGNLRTYLNGAQYALSVQTTNYVGE